jgi:hypothetical protein
MKEQHSKEKEKIKGNNASRVANSSIFHYIQFLSLLLNLNNNFIKSIEKYQDF